MTVSEAESVQIRTSSATISDQASALELHLIGRPADCFAHVLVPCTLRRYGVTSSLLPILSLSRQDSLRIVMMALPFGLQFYMEIFNVEFTDPFPQAICAKTLLTIVND